LGGCFGGLRSPWPVRARWTADVDFQFDNRHQAAHQQSGGRAASSTRPAPSPRHRTRHQAPSTRHQ
jgi:hypothetical protein